MMKGDGWIDLGMCWNALYWSALTDWRDEYAPGVSTDEVLANGIRRIVFACNAHPGGHYEVMVRVHARRRWQSEMYFSKVQRVGSLYYIT